jgi:hypothetical protein
MLGSGLAFWRTGDGLRYVRSDHTMKLAFNVFGVLVLLAVLAGILIPTGAVCGPSKERSITRHEISQAGVALFIYDREYGRLPAETDNAMLVQVLEGDNPKKLKFRTLDHKQSKTGQFLDGWGKPLLFKPSDTGMLIRSAGEDGRYHAEDDITQEVQIRPGVR